MRVVSLIFGLVVLVGCGTHTSSTPTPSNPTQTNTQLPPSSASLGGVVSIVGPKGLCSGAVISSSKILTAAHCVSGARGAETIAHTSLGNFSSSYAINLGIGTKEDTHDIAIISFDRTIANPSDILTLGGSVEAGDQVTLAGYGCDNLQANRGFGRLRYGTNQVERISDFIELSSPTEQFTNALSTWIRGPKQYSATCSGDSGSPLLKLVNGQYYIVGVSHAGDVYGKKVVSHYTDVVNQEVNREFVKQQVSN